MKMWMITLRQEWKNPRREDSRTFLNKLLAAWIVLNKIYSLVLALHAKINSNPTTLIAFRKGNPPIMLIFNSQAQNIYPNFVQTLLMNIQ